jgi:threonine synthase
MMACPLCGGGWLTARYDDAQVAAELPRHLAERPFDMWRYRELLPIIDFNPAFPMGEGGTPLVHAQSLGLMLGLPHIYIKDERQGPTNSFKDRQAAVGIAALKEAGVTEMVLASTGNVAIAFSAFAARAGIKLWAFLTSLVPAEKMREVAIYGTQVVKVTATYDQAKRLAAEFARQRGLYLEGGARAIPSTEAMKTIAYEICEQLPSLLADANAAAPAWRAPDWYFQSVSGGMGPLGVARGFHDLQRLGWIETLPRLGIIQAEGCSPMAQAWRHDERVAVPVASPRTHIATLATGDPGRTYSLLYDEVKAHGGIFESVTDEETFRTIHILAKMEGISVEPAAAVAFAGLIKMARAGLVHHDEVIVVNCTGHTMPVERVILGEGWSRNVVLPTRAETSATTPQEGLLAALSQVTDDRFPRVAIVDDTPDARRLIRRILQAQGNYEIFEAANGSEALALAARELPDLMILDLMMPEVDGFAVLDALKANPQTAPIPVIVVTAKDLTPEERARLQGQVHALMQKGEFMNDELAGEVRDAVAGDPSDPPDRP